MFEIKIKLTTMSSCLIGNQTESFSVGGVDQSTTVDENGNPIIHGSAFKGAFRNIVREREKISEKMTATTKAYVKSLVEKTLTKYQAIPEEEKTEKINKMLANLEEKAKNPKAEYIFGMEGINGMPRLFCSDFRVPIDQSKSKEDYFLIETKTSLEEKEEQIVSNPRTYKVVKPGVIFEGFIRFVNPFFEESKDEADKLEDMKCELEKALKAFNDGIYGIGNSKSRGYGQVQVEILQ